MQFGINLLPVQKAALAEKKFLIKLKILLAGFLALYIASLVALSAFSVYVSAMRKGLETEMAKTETEVKSFEKKEVLALTLKNRAESISQILGNREKDLSKQDLLIWAETLMSPGVFFNDISLSASEVTLNGEAGNAFALGNLLEELQFGEKKFSWLVLESLTRSAKGNYSFLLKGALENE